jgi:hypothetical protein
LKYYTGPDASFELVLDCLEQNNIETMVEPEEVAKLIKSSRAEIPKPKGRKEERYYSREFTPLILHDPRKFTRDLKKCPHGVLAGKKCAICDPEGFRKEYGDI